jgi:hypothetical protein
MESCLMTIHQILRTHSIINSVLVCVCVLIIGSAITKGYHHHNDGSCHVTCLICISINLFFGLISSEIPSLACSKNLYIPIVSYPILFYSNINLFYHPRSPPLLISSTLESPKWSKSCIKWQPWTNQSLFVRWFLGNYYRWIKYE